MQDHHHSGLRQLCRRFLPVILMITTNDLQEIISEPIHIPSHSSSCIEFIFSNHSNFILDGGVHTSLHPHFYQQFTHCKFNFKVEYLPRYQVWLKFKKSDSDVIKKAIEGVNCSFVFWEECIFKYFHCTRNPKLPLH